MSLETDGELRVNSNQDLLPPVPVSEALAPDEISRFARFKWAVTQVLDRSGVEYLNDQTRGPLL